MTYKEPAHTAPRHTRSTVGVLLATALALLLAATAFAATSHLLNDKDRTYLSTDGWPVRGQGAYVLGTGQPAVSPDEQPVPIASLAKVMTAYLILKHYPLHGRDSGRQFVFGARDVVDTERMRREDQSTVDIRAGEQLSERDALMAILLPSANNVADLVARQVDGSVASFVAEMNHTAQALGMSHTTYTDPSGYDAGTVSTALDQLRLARLVAEDKTLEDMMATRSYSLPVAGEISNTDALLGHDGFVGMKTGSDDAAGGCFMFRSERHTASGDITLIGVVLGQQGHNLITAGLYAAKQLVDRLAPSAASAAGGLGDVAVESLGQTGRVAQGDQVPAGDLVCLDTQALLGDAALEACWEKPVVRPDQHLDRYIRPLLEVAPLPEGRL
ncbi:MAG: D-alanyl-D-alanine carboxypeptidase [Acidimicrobiaceae bacterium]|nr:D-alanyl-D-alanine carboxypeptidase [Acidimicrobiaceae bacterium]